MTPTILTALLIVALVLASIDEIQAKGRALTPWATILIAAVLLYGRLT